MVLFLAIFQAIYLLYIFLIHKNRNTNETSVTYEREYNKANIESFKQAVKNISWNEVLNESNDPETLIS